MTKAQQHLINRINKIEGISQETEYKFNVKTIHGSNLYFYWNLGGCMISIMMYNYNDEIIEEFRNNYKKGLSEIERLIKLY